ncbi:uncharacterized protein MELLADRAFT_58554 [Melampsora larici-populina 98AG31]|uniref:Uncharacterized protein n=1 Tax=Melampsora larici-populina (strain 98AG31 / pathotype 3-4-7) TaxID=747676 RepID=F4R3Y3_MELLP|nr:uncharacterized protein MELLADRAFT_58554 [Melampsora larici-populina 98AG31]EGG13082.1 hypothetical protein MELLADRAFT_58554 [Melampsora larici-populina 98AG31]
MVNLYFKDDDLKDVNDKIHSLGEMIINYHQSPSIESGIQNEYSTEKEAIDKIVKYVKDFEYTQDLITRNALEILYQIFQLPGLKKDLGRGALMNIFSDPSTGDRNLKIYMEIIQKHAREEFKDLNIKITESLSYKDDPADVISTKSWKDIQNGTHNEKELLALMENIISKRIEQISSHQVDKLTNSDHLIKTLLIIIKSSKSEKINLFDKLYLFSSPEVFLKTEDRLGLLFSLEDKVFAQEACRGFASNYPLLKDRYQTLVTRGARANLSNCFWEYMINSKTGNKLIKTSNTDDPELIEAYELLNLSSDAIKIDKALETLNRFSQEAFDKPKEWIKDSFKSIINKLYLYGISIKKLQNNQRDVRYIKVLKILKDLSEREKENLENQIYVTEALKALELISFDNQKPFGSLPFAPPEMTDPSLSLYSYRFNWHINIVLTDLKHYPLAWIPEGFGK